MVKCKPKRNSLICLIQSILTNQSSTSYEYITQEKRYSVIYEAYASIKTTPYSPYKGLVNSDSLPTHKANILYSLEVYTLLDVDKEVVIDGILYKIDSFHNINESNREIEIIMTKKGAISIELINHVENT